MKTSTNYWLYEKEQKDLLSYLEATVGTGVANDHYKLKTSDRGANPEHCREVCILAKSLPEAKMKKVLARYGVTVKQLLRAATGRPRKNAKASDKLLAETKSGNILNDLRKAAGRQVKASTYKAGRIVHPESAEAIKADLKQATEFATEFEIEVMNRSHIQALAEDKRRSKKSAPATAKKHTRKKA